MPPCGVLVFYFPFTGVSVLKNNYMKHSVEVTLILVGLFLAAQFMGLFVTSRYMESVDMSEEGEVNVTWGQLPSIGGVSIERPDVDPSKSVWLIMAAIIIGTVLLLLLVRMQHAMLWRLWFFLASLILPPFEEFVL